MNTLLIVSLFSQKLSYLDLSRKAKGRENKYVYFLFIV
ncbi:hypothetical protein CSC44_5969 [Pseudomonas aeruginosa]|nr:hypothetical protein CSC44_5969 [Pseudomonas aeruginosa]